MNFAGIKVPGSLKSQNFNILRDYLADKLFSEFSQFSWISNCKIDYCYKKYNLSINIWPFIYWPTLNSLLSFFNFNILTKPRKENFLGGFNDFVDRPIFKIFPGTYFRGWMKIKYFLGLIFVNLSEIHIFRKL